MSTTDAGVGRVSAATWAALFRGKNAVFAVALGGGVVLHALNIYVATTVMPSAVAEIGGLDYYSWATTLFVLASILGAALSPNIMGRAGARTAYFIAVVAFAVGTAVCGMAPNMSVLLAGRFVQGFGGGLLYALAYSAIRLVYPSQLWGRAIGLISAAWGVSTLIGPAIGGLFAQNDAWRWAFGALVPFAALFGLIAAMTLPGRGEGSVSRHPPIMQLALLAAATVALSLGSLGDQMIWSVACVGGALLAAILLLLIELQGRNTLLPRDTFSRQSRLGVLYATGALLVIGMQPEIYVPYLLQVLHGFSPLVAGYLAALMAIGWTSGSLVSGSWTGGAADRAVRAGPVFGVVGLALLAAFMPQPFDNSWWPVFCVAAGLVSVGFGIGMAWPHLVTRVFETATVDQRDQATGGVTTVQLFATALGSAGAGTLAKLAGVSNPGGELGASSTAFWLFTCFAIVPLMGAALAAAATCKQT